MNKTVKKVISIGIVTTMFISLAACGTKQSTDISDYKGIELNLGNDTTNAHYEFGSEYPFGAIIKSKDCKISTFEEPAATVNASEIYSNLNYNASMLWGDYYAIYDGAKDDYQKYYSGAIPTTFADSVPFTDIIEFIGETEHEHNKHEATEMTVFPVEFRSGPSELFEDVGISNEYNWCELRYVSTNSNNELHSYHVAAAYEVQGNQIVFNILEKYSIDEVNKTVLYEFNGKSITYDFKFEGPKLTLSKDGNSVDLLAAAFIAEYSYESGYYAGEGIPSNGIAEIDLTYMTEQKIGLAFKGEDGNAWHTGNYASRYESDGTFTLWYENAAGTVEVAQYAALILGSNGLYLNDGTNEFYYMNPYIDYKADKNSAYKSTVNVRPEDQEKYEALEEEQKVELEEAREDLYDDLAEALGGNGINVTVDKVSGEIVMNDDILFDFDSYEIKEEGKAQLNDFAQIFGDILASEKYFSFASAIEIQGHTDTTGDYDYNMTLSENRAESVLNECVAANPLLADLMYAKGYSSDNPVYGDDGQVDDAASRRVAFILYIDPDYVN